MTMLTKAMIGALLLSISTASLVNVASANTETSHAEVAFDNDDGALSITEADDVNWDTINLSSLTTLNPVASNSASGQLELTQTSAHPTGNYSVHVSQTGHWIDNEGHEVVKNYHMMILLNGAGIPSERVAVSETSQPPRGKHYTNYLSSGEFALDLTGWHDLSDALGKDLSCELTWRLVNAE
ncbi:chitinase [Leuconostoc falkenbergense]|uniref:chitinase n=1 Tax=Leuconostoc falkenbergense TaxID=2766470 RepID=UPI0024A92A62|nr:chitinase [Leuconostoc falkenbergense]MDI6553501.1 chitinase [Leuconostoc falkenbergense]